MERVEARITKVLTGEGFYCFVPYEHTDKLSELPIRCTAVLSDGRTITERQRRFIYALLRDMSMHFGYPPEDMKELMKYQYVAETGGEYFSVGDCSVTTANRFIEFVIEFCVRWGVPTKQDFVENSPDIGRYVYACLMNKKCCLTGRACELHHIDAVGAGRDREEIVHKGMRVLPLSHEKHMEAHTLGRDTFLKKYHLLPVTLDDKLCRRYGLKG